MKKQVLFIFLLFNTLFFCNAQLQTLKGKIIADYNNLEDININNVTQKSNYTSQKQGYFSIKAAIGDTLNFSAIQFNAKQVVLKKEDFNEKLFFVTLEIAVNSIKEVVVIQEKNGYEMGVLSKKAKEYTPAERKLKTASDFDPTAALFGVSVGLDPIINAITGRTKMLKNEVKVESKELALLKIQNWFSEDYFTKTLKIPLEKVNGFEYFIVEDSTFVNTLKTKNKTMTKFLLVDLARKYLELQKQN